MKQKGFLILLLILGLVTAVPTPTIAHTANNNGDGQSQPSTANTSNNDLAINASNIAPAYVVNSAPWGSTSNQTSLDLVFGSGEWQALNYGVDPTILFAPERSFVYLEGSDTNALALQNFMNTNLSLVENWVANGNCLLINAAPSQGGGIGLGFGGVQLQYPHFTNSVNATNSAHPIFNGPHTPIGSSFSGNSFAHARILGGNLSYILTNNVLGEKDWGMGYVAFGGMTPSNFHSPQPQANNLRANLIDHVASRCLGWVGVQNSDWNNSNNWKFGKIPAAINDVALDPLKLNGANAWPVLEVDAMVNNLIIHENAELTIPHGRSLTILGNFTNEGQMPDTFGTLILSGRNDEQTLMSTSALGNLTISTPLIKLYWPFDEASGGTVNDQSGNGHNGALVNALWDTANVAPTLFDNPSSLFFNGGNAFAHTSNPGLTGSFSVAIWMRANSAMQWRSLVGYGTQEFGAAAPYRLILGNPGEIYVSIGNGSSWQSATLNTGWNVNQWYHLATTYNAQTGSLRVYQNGIDVGGLSTGITPISAGGLIIGSHQGNQQFFHGNLDDFRIYNRVLTTVEIADLSAGEELQGRVLLGAPLQINGDLTINRGILDVSEDNHSISLMGDFTNYNGDLSAGDGEFRFDGAGIQTMTLNRPTDFFDLFVGNNVILEEAVSGDQANVLGTLINEGTIRHTHSINSAGLLHFGLTEVSIDISDLGLLTSIQVDRVDADHPEASGAASNIATGRYWMITPTGNNYTATLILPHDNLNDPKVCRWLDGLGSGAGWDCHRDSFDETVAIRSGITQFSDWAIGNEVGPTAVSLQSIMITNPNSQGGIIILLVVLLAALSGAWLWLLRRRLVGSGS